MPEFFTAIALSDFDGMHLGHNNLINTAKNYADKHGLKAVAFNVSPVNAKEKVLFTKEEKLSEFININTEPVFYPIDIELLNKGLNNFINKILIDEYKCKAIFISEDFIFGNDKVTKEKLNDLNDSLKICIMPKLFVNNTRVDSGVIADLIKEKNFTLAQELMGRSYSIQGKVTSGKQLGRTIGFPTANLKAPVEKLLPPNGVYVTQTIYNGNYYNSITNVGVNPTVSGKSQSVETYIFDFSEDLYNKDITVNFFYPIREEKTFRSVDELMNQISKDECFAREYLKSNHKIM